MEARYQENSQSVDGGENHEKKPMMKRVKDKAKKIKNSMISKMAHGHNADGDHEHDHDNEHDHVHDNDVVSEEEEVYEEAEEEREAVPEVHGAPMYESEAARHSAGGRDENLGPGKDVTSGEATATTTVEDPSGPKEKRFGTTAASDESQLLYPSTATGGDEAGESHLRSTFQAMAVSDKPKGTEGVLESPPTSSDVRGFSPDKPLQDAPKEGTEEQMGSSYTDMISSTATASAKDTEFSGAIGSAKPNDAEGVVESPPTGIHDQFSSPDKPLQDAPKEGTEEQMSSSYTDMISSTATASAKDTEFSGAIGSAKPKDAEGVVESPPTGIHDQFSPDKPQQDTPKDGTEEQKGSSYTDKISSTAAAAKDAAVSGAIGSAVYGKKIASTVYGKVSEGGTAIIGKGMNQEEKNDDIKTGQPVNGVSDKDKGVSVKEYVVGKLRPSDEDRALSEVISDAMHTKKQEAVGAAPEDVKGIEHGSSEESGSGKGMVEKIKGVVTSWIGAGSTAGAAQDSPMTTSVTDTDIKGKEA